MDPGRCTECSAALNEGEARPGQVEFPVRTVQLDVRQWPLWQRHPSIFAAFDGLQPEDTLRLVNDHEPRPLRLQFEELRPGRFTWSARNLGNDRWEVEIRRIAAEPADGASATETIAAVLRRSALFGAMDSAERLRLAAQSSLRRFDHGAAITAQGEDWPHIGIVCEGTVAVIGGSAEGRELLLYEVLPLESFGEVSAVDDGATLGTATVVSRVAVVAFLPRPAFRRALERDEHLARSVALLCAQRFRLLAERLTAHVSQPTLARIAAAILPYAPPERGLAPSLPPLDLMSLTDLAIAAGTVREVAGRALIALEQAKAIERSRGRIVRVDRERLSAFT
jgi:uncharacterized protein (DUF2249 family)/CRP-like cAMP-binding protein